jgi:glucans biosynthesis protein C
MPAILLAGAFFDGGAAEDRFAGGWHWQAAAASVTEGVLATCVSLWAVGYFRRRHNHLRPLARRMAQAAYGAFIVHPPVIVGRALAIQRLPVPAELKFACVLTGGVVASFGLATLVAPLRRIAGMVGTRRPTATELLHAVPPLDAAPPGDARPPANRTSDLAH